MQSRRIYIPCRVLVITDTTTENIRLYYASRKNLGKHIVAGLSVRLYVPNLAHNFVIWSRILQLFHRNDYNIETICRAQHLGRYLEGQGHSMTLQQNHVQSITSLFEVGFYNYFTEMITILRQRDMHNLWLQTVANWVEIGCLWGLGSQRRSKNKLHNFNLERTSSYLCIFWPVVGN
jgi:hypothetical protein